MSVAVGIASAVFPCQSPLLLGRINLTEIIDAGVARRFHVCLLRNGTGLLVFFRQLLQLRLLLLGAAVSVLFNCCVSFLLAVVSCVTWLRSRGSS